jgi:hypothetical protein
MMIDVGRNASCVAVALVISSGATKSARTMASAVARATCQAKFCDFKERSALFIHGTRCQW